jgi:hypothetical protein
MANNQESREENIMEVRDIIDSKVEIRPNIYQLIDKANNKLEVDLNTGLIYRYKDNIRVLCNTVDTSKKENGYLYCHITIQTKSGLVQKEYSQHGVICMLAHTEEFDELSKSCNQVVPNHKDNCPWNNLPSNLEWTTQTLNKLHGKVVNGLWFNRYYVNSMTHRVWTEIKHNQSDKDFHTLLIPISVDDLIAYQKYVGKGLESYWGLRSKEYISERDLVAFVNWLDKNRPNQERQVRNYNLSKTISFDEAVKQAKVNREPTLLDLSTELSFDWERLAELVDEMNNN